MASEKMSYKHCIEEEVNEAFTFDFDNRSNKVQNNKLKINGSILIILGEENLGKLISVVSRRLN